MVNSCNLLALRKTIVLEDKRRHRRHPRDASPPTNIPYFFNAAVAPWGIIHERGRIWHVKYVKKKNPGRGGHSRRKEREKNIYIIKKRVSPPRF